MPKVKFNLNIEPAQLAQLEAVSTSTGASVSELIRRAIAQFLRTIPDSLRRS